MAQPKPLTEKKRCWICFGEDGDSEADWVKPCACSLVSHEHCLLEWITESQKPTMRSKKVTCPQCSAIYRVTEARSMTLAVLRTLDHISRGATPYITLLGVGCSVLLTGITYGAYTVMTMLGPEHAQRLLGQPSNWTWKTWFGLPMIPIVLISPHWRLAGSLLPFATVFCLRAMGVPSLHQLNLLTWPPSLTTIIATFPWLRLVYNTMFRFFKSQLLRWKKIERHELELDQQQYRNRGISIINALLWPTVSQGIGSCLNQLAWIRKTFPEPYHRNLLGGCLYIVIKDLTDLLYKYKRITQRRSRRIKNHDE